ncbi:MAG: hypothetical protein R3F59_38290, partial [Myxococcota bacterium]
AGDPQGEFVALQLRAEAGGASPEALARIEVLRRSHANHWLGGLARVVADDGLRFRRGFVSACRVRVHPDVGSLVDVRELGTVEALHLHHYGTVALFEQGALGALRTLGGSCAAVLEAGRPLGITRLASVDDLDPADAARLAGCRSLPALAAVALPNGARGLHAWTGALGPFASLREVAVSETLLALGRWRAALAARVPQVQHLTLRGPLGTVEIARDAGGDRVTLRVAALAPEAAAALVQAWLADDAVLAPSDRVQVAATHGAGAIAAWLTGRVADATVAPA